MNHERAALRIEYLPVPALIPYARSARTHSDAQIDQVGASVKEFGWTNPVLIDGQNAIIAGRARVEAAKRLGLNEIPCIELSGLSEAQKRAYILADNKIAQNAGWDEKLLALEFADLKEFDFNLELTGFSLDEIDALIAKAEMGGGLADPDSVPEAPPKPVTVPGDLWTLHKHRLLCGDSTKPQDVHRLMAGESPLLMVTDPPYGVNYDPEWRQIGWIGARATGKVQNDDRIDWKDAFALFPGDVGYIWHAGLYADEVAQSLKCCGFELRSQIIWAKQHFVISRGAYHWQHEPCWYAVRKGKSANWSGDRKQTTLWQIANHGAFGGQKEDETTNHGTQKPVECMRRPIANHTNPGQSVYEPFMGSGTTLIAAESISRVAFGMEIDPTYVDVAVERWQKFTGRQATLEGDGRTFEQIKAQRCDRPLPLLPAEDLHSIH